MHGVARHGSLELFKLLLDRGGELTSRTLHCAATGANLEIVKYLIEEIGIGVNAEDTPKDLPLPKYYGTPLNYAVYHPIRSSKREEVVRYLLQHGADPSLRDCWGIQDAIGWAERDCREDLIKIILDWQNQRPGLEPGGTTTLPTELPKLPIRSSVDCYVHTE
ncbi:Hypothetical protein D9617_2g052720 [Elsinoe fawcettii]|nr:Hypothetical protein D9617_2g052720 [Elsinoe fawcettii]